MRTLPSYENRGWDTVGDDRNKNLGAEEGTSHRAARSNRATG